MGNITLNTDNSLTINVKPIVKIKTSIEIIGTKTELPIEITADFTDVPTHLHETYLMSLLMVKLWEVLKKQIKVIKS